MRLLQKLARSEAPSETASQRRPTHLRTTPHAHDEIKSVR
jgi:hypothetical protein